MDDDQEYSNSPNAPILKQEEIYSVPNNSCFRDLGDEVAPGPDGSCPAGYVPKYDYSYPWGYAVSGRYGYIGTGSNIPCNVPYWGQLEPWQSTAVACGLTRGVNVDRYGPEFSDNVPP